MRDFLVKAVSTFFYVGYLPLIPGTFASLVAVGLFCLLRPDTFSLALLIIVLTLAGFLVAGRMERLSGKKDARCIVIDEICGMLIALFAIPFEFKYICAAFFLFRLLDTLKPFPAGALEKQRGSLGIMSDDLVAGVYANLVLQAALRFAHFRAS